MPKITFTTNLERHLPTPTVEVDAPTVRAALDAVFDDHPQLRSYIVDDQDRLRQHVLVFVNAEMIRDRVRLSDAIDPSAELLVMQALSGG